MEKAIISQRVKSGMANATAKGRAIGRPLTKIETLPNAFLKHYLKYRDRQLILQSFQDYAD